MAVRCCKSRRSNHHFRWRKINVLQNGYSCIKVLKKHSLLVMFRSVKGQASNRIHVARIESRPAPTCLLLASNTHVIWRAEIVNHRVKHFLPAQNVVVNHGVAEEMVRAFRDAAAEFFALPPEDKLPYYSDDCWISQVTS